MTLSVAGMAPPSSLDVREPGGGNAPLVMQRAQLDLRSSTRPWGGQRAVRCGSKAVIATATPGAPIVGFAPRARVGRLRPTASAAARLSANKWRRARQRERPRRPGKRRGLFSAGAGTLPRRPVQRRRPGLPSLATSPASPIPSRNVLPGTNSEDGSGAMAGSFRPERPRRLLDPNDDPSEAARMAPRSLSALTRPTAASTGRRLASLHQIDTTAWIGASVLLFRAGAAAKTRAPAQEDGDDRGDENSGGQLQSAAGRSDRRLYRRAADQAARPPLRRSRDFRRNPRKCARPRHVHHPVDVLSDQRQSDGAADHDRRAAARVGAAHHRGHSLFRLCPAGSKARP